MGIVTTMGRSRWPDRRWPTSAWRGPGTVLGLSRHLEVRPLGNDRGEPDRVIVGHENADAFGDSMRELVYTHRS